MISSQEFLKARCFGGLVFPATQNPRRIVDRPAEEGQHVFNGAGEQSGALVHCMHGAASMAKAVNGKQRGDVVSCRSKYRVNLRLQSGGGGSREMSRIFARECKILKVTCRSLYQVRVVKIQANQHDSCF